MSDSLGTLTRRLTAAERAEAIAGGGFPPGIEQPFLHGRDDPIDLLGFDSLMAEFHRRRIGGDWDGDRAVSDRWLAPRLHHTLRLFRTEAAEREMWLWLAIRQSTYVDWRWAGKEDVVEERWLGPIHKQSFARLWWGAEVFRDGRDYRPVVRAFVRQDLPNSYLHRPVVRCRSLALGILDVIAPEGREEEISSDQVNDLARCLNLATAGAPPEAATGYQRDDSVGYEQWVLSGRWEPVGWDLLPDGPSAADTSASSLEGGLAVANRGWSFTANGTMSTP